MVHLMELLNQRSSSGQGIHYSITRRCPLGCAHCSTNSLAFGEHISDEDILKFTSTFTASDHPKWVLITGGEPMLRPDLVAEIVGMCHLVGTKVSVITGMFFARGKGVPAPILKSLQNVDLLFVSMDEFHEARLSRSDVLEAISEFRNHGIDIALQVTGTGADDAYLLGLIEETRSTFADQVPMLVRYVQPVGRAKMLDLPETDHHSHLLPSHRILPSPCGAAGWPVVAFSGAIVACCNQDAIDGPTPPHLALGHIENTSWPDVRNACENRPLLQLIRTVGPQYLERHLNGGSECDGYCETCLGLRTDATMLAKASTTANLPVMKTAKPMMAQLQHDEMFDIYLTPEHKHLAYLGLSERDTTWH